MEPLLGKTLSELQTIAIEAGLPRFVGKQLCEWLYRHRVSSFDEMSNISLKARQALQQHYCIGRVPPTREAVSVDGTRKYLFPASVEKPSPSNSQLSTANCQLSTIHTALADRSRFSRDKNCQLSTIHTALADRSRLSRDKNYQLVETVWLPEEDRTTLCVSTQAGCKMGCRFCMTGTLGFHGNLTADAILNQVFFFMSDSDSGLTNLVFMGEGEPMDNIDHVLRALNALTADWGLGWSPKRITISTVGILPRSSANPLTHSSANPLTRFLNETDCHLAISLHNAFPDERAAIMPAQKLTPIEDVLDLVCKYDWSHQRRLSFEYICWSGVNDDIPHAKQLLRLVSGLPCRVNLIRFHQTNQQQSNQQRSDQPSNSAAITPLFPPSDEQRMIAFRDYLNAHGVTCTIRKSRGEDILAACGMLVNALDNG